MIYTSYIRYMAIYVSHSHIYDVFARVCGYHKYIYVYNYVVFVCVTISIRMKVFVWVCSNGHLVTLMYVIYSRVCGGILYTDMHVHAHTHMHACAGRPDFGHNSFYKVCKWWVCRRRGRADHMGRLSRGIPPL